jgi:peptide deformylase
MAIRTIVIYPDPELREVSRELVEPGAASDLIRDMAETMYAADGAGLAAIQVGQPLRLFIIDPVIAGGNEIDPPLVFINPEFVSLGEQQETADEGCLSLPGIFLPIARSRTATIRATDADGEPFELGAEGFFARALQHEMDHLEGRLIVDYVGRIKRQLIERRLRSEASSRAATR